MTIGICIHIDVVEATPPRIYMLEDRKTPISRRREIDAYRGSALKSEHEVIQKGVTA